VKNNKLLLFLDKSSWGALYFVAAVSPFISLFAPLGLAPAFILAALFPSISAIAYRRYVWKEVFKSSLYKVIIVFFIFSISSVLWAIDPDESFKMWYRLLLLFLGVVALIEFIKMADIKHKRTLCNTLAVGFFVALLAANIEILSDGVISKFFQSFKDKKYNYELTDLNRGASYIVILFWCVFAWLLVSRKFIFVALLTIITIFTVLSLESQSSSMALIISIAVLPIILLFGKKALKAMMLLSIFAVITVASVAYKIQPQILFETLPNIPNSASEYRLYIWSFTADKAMESPILGWGLNSARSIPVNEDDYVLGGRHPLPLHPHNNVLQLWLELGIIGLVIFITFLVFQINSIKNMNYSIFNDHCRTSFDSNGRVGLLGGISHNIPMSLFFGLFAAYFAIGETGYGMWQNWWVSGGLLSLVFMHSCFSIKQN
jgi:O-antigen ligase